MNPSTICGIVASVCAAGIIALLFKLWRMADIEYFNKIEITHKERECESLRRELFIIREEVEKLKKP